MSRVVGRVTLNLVVEKATVAGVLTLLQAIRDWEQLRGVDISIEVDAPEMTNEEATSIFNHLHPILPKQLFIRRKI